MDSKFQVLKRRGALQPKKMYEECKDVIEGV